MSCENCDGRIDGSRSTSPNVGYVQPSQCTMRSCDTESLAIFDLFLNITKHMFSALLPRGTHIPMLQQHADTDLHLVLNKAGAWVVVDIE